MSLFTVSRELGHSSPKLLGEAYGHLQQRRQRLEVVQYGEVDPEDLLGDWRVG